MLALAYRQAPEVANRHGWQYYPSAGSVDRSDEARCVGVSPFGGRPAPLSRVPWTSMRKSHSSTRRLLSRAKSWLLAVALAGTGTGVAGGATAQVPDQLPEQLPPEAAAIVGQSPTHQDIVDALLESGLTRSQVRSRLQALGYDPGLVDQYYDIVESGGQAIPPGQAPTELTATLSEIGVVLRSARPGGFMMSDTLPMDSLALDSLALDSVAVDSLAPGELPIFGRELFFRVTTQFQPVTTGPVDPGYRLGPGDQLFLILSGDVEAAHTLEVTREGYIFIPDVGPVAVNGLTLRDLEDRLYDRLGDVYSGVRPGPSATTQFQATLGQLRSNQVFVVGEVERPGAYQVPGTATVFSALYAARGPNPNGSFRHIEVRRGGEVMREVDLYDYLIRGDSKADIRLEQGDIVFVPVIGPQVGIRGAVRRSALFELQEQEGLRDLLGFAGRMEAQALLRRVQIDRIVPPGALGGGVDRVLVDVDVQQVFDPGGDPIPLRDGDIVEVFSVSEERRNRLIVTGGIRRPGVYEWTPGMTIWDLIERAEGLDDEAYTPRAHIHRLSTDDNTRTLVRTPLLADATGNPLGDVTLADRDSVVIFTREELVNASTVTIEGFVRNPGQYALPAGMTVRDLVLASGGFVRGANIVEAEVSRRVDSSQRTDTTSYSIRVALGSDSADDLNGFTGARLPPPPQNDQQQIPVWVPHADEVVLQHDDRVFIRKAAGYEALNLVQVSGQVLGPGGYVLQTRQEHLTDVLERAGGVTPQANLAGARLTREGNLVATDARLAIQDPDSRFNIVLEAGDSIHVPAYDPTVLVTGAIGFETRVLYVPGEDLDYYIRRAGGYLPDADPGRATVTHQNGARELVRRTLVFRREPTPSPGSNVHVPAKPANAAGFNVNQFLTRSLSVIGTTLTILLAIDRL
ncbi:MAG: hypothetical protein GEU90_00425 [Gemmatimonas sp.]|nr:hypothetical protein [Gemmatimonas sp.]